MSKNPYAKQWLNEAMREFERLVQAGHIHVPGTPRFERENADLARRGYYYCHGETNQAFAAFLHGLMLGRIFWEGNRYE